MVDEYSFLCLPKEFKKDIYIYPLKIKEVLNHPYFTKIKKIFTISQEELEDELTEYGKKTVDYIPTPFEFLLNNAYHNKDFNFLVQEGFKLFFHEEVTFLFEQKLLILGNPEKEIALVKDVSELRIIKEDEYFNIQNLIRVSIGEKILEPPIIDEDPRVKRIKMKARYRDKIKAEKGKGLTLGDSLASICCMGLGLTPLNIGEMSYAAISVIMERYQEHEKYDTDIKSILAGADSKKIKPKYWIRNLDNNK